MLEQWKRENLMLRFAQHDKAPVNLNEVKDLLP